MLGTTKQLPDSEVGFSIMETDTCCKMGISLLIFTCDVYRCFKGLIILYNVIRYVYFLNRRETFIKF
jgi:hypothetical protein